MQLIMRLLIKSYTNNFHYKKNSKFNHWKNNKLPPLKMLLKTVNLKLKKKLIKQIKFKF